MRTRHLLAMCVLMLVLATCGLLGMAANEPGKQSDGLAACSAGGQGPLGVAGQDREGD